MNAGSVDLTFDVSEMAQEKDRSGKQRQDCVVKRIEEVESDRLWTDQFWCRATYVSRCGSQLYDG